MNEISYRYIVSSDFKQDDLKISIAQLNFHVGDISANTNKIIAAIDKAKEAEADLLVFPELCVTGYPPEDLLFRKGLYAQVEAALEIICSHVDNIDVIIGHPRSVVRQGKTEIYNSACLIRNREVFAVYDKWALPNYSVFDEKRYFQPGKKGCVVDIKGIPVGITICEDIWEQGPINAAVKNGATLVININASPFHLGKMETREAEVKKRVQETGVPIVYVNLVGGQDELVFDGASFVMNAAGDVVSRFATFKEQQTNVLFDVKTIVPNLLNIEPHPTVHQAIFDALVLGVKDYVQKNGFKGIVLGLSGGIDSALTLVVAVKALGAENVEAIMLPTRYTSSMSLQDAEKLAENLNVNYRSIEIEPAFKTLLSMLSEEFAGTEVDATEENIQARIRGIVLMGISNKKGKMVLTTGNKSEMAVGYSTLYGDMAGGFDVLKDVPKTVVFEISRYCNRETEVIPVRIIERPPSAELRDDQTDQDSLPDYDVLDAILDYYIEQEMSIDAIVNLGFEAEVVYKIARMVDINEYKRRQAPPGVRITPKAFGRDRRYPITSGFVDKER